MSLKTLGPLYVPNAAALRNHNAQRLDLQDGHPSSEVSCSEGTM